MADLGLPTRYTMREGDICIGLCSVLRPHQHTIGYMGDGFYMSKDPTNSIKVLKENLQKKITQRTKKTQKCVHTKMVRQIQQ